MLMGLPSLANRANWIAALVALLALVSGCSDVNGAAISETVNTDGDQGIRQVDASGKRLPFVTVHPHRWSPANDGTVYEPCTALSDLELRGLDIDSGSAKDGAGTDGQTARGCRWEYERTGAFLQWTVAQVVGNSPGLSAEKALKSGTLDEWLQDRRIGGREIGVHRLAGSSNCDTYVQSGRAAVTTIVLFHGASPPPPSEICDRALAFTAATISKMPI